MLDFYFTGTTNTGINTYSDGFTTTFPMDFMIAEKFGGIRAVRDTYRRAAKEWQENVRYYADLVLTLNHRLWALYQTNEKLARVYEELYFEAYDKGFELFDGEDKRIYLAILD